MDSELTTNSLITERMFFETTSCEAREVVEDAIIHPGTTFLAVRV